MKATPRGERLLALAVLAGLLLVLGFAGGIEQGTISTRVGGFVASTLVGLLVLAFVWRRR